MISKNKLYTIFATVFFFAEALRRLYARGIHYIWRELDLPVGAFAFYGIWISSLVLAALGVTAATLRILKLDFDLGMFAALAVTFVGVSVAGLWYLTARGHDLPSPAMGRYIVLGLELAIGGALVLRHVRRTGRLIDDGSVGA